MPCPPMPGAVIFPCFQQKPRHRVFLMRVSVFTAVARCFTAKAQGSFFSLLQSCRESPSAKLQERCLGVGVSVGTKGICMAVATGDSRVARRSPRRAGGPHLSACRPCDLRRGQSPRGTHACFLRKHRLTACISCPG